MMRTIKLDLTDIKLFEGSNDDVFIVTRDSLKDLYLEGAYEATYREGYRRTEFLGREVRLGEASV